MPTTHHSLPHDGPLSFGQALRVLGHGHAGFATDDKDHAFLMHAPQILSMKTSRDPPGWSQSGHACPDSAALALKAGAATFPHNPGSTPVSSPAASAFALR